MVRTGIVLAGTDVYLPPLGGATREWVVADTHDPSLVRPYAPDTVNTQAYADMRAFRAPIVETRELTYFVLLALIAIHIASAVIAEIKKGGTIISAMFTGRRSTTASQWMGKRLSGPSAIVTGRKVAARSASEPTGLSAQEVASCA